MTLEQLRIFIGVAEREHVTKAAQDLNVTQSAASGAIATLEARHGVPLFHRVGRGIQLTEAGSAFLEEAGVQKMFCGNAAGHLRQYPKATEYRQALTLKNRSALVQTAYS